MNTLKTFLIGFFGIMSIVLFSTLWSEVRKNLTLKDRIEALREDVKNVLADLRSERMLVEICETALAEYEKPQQEPEIRRCINADFDPIAGPGVMVSPAARAAWAAILKVKSDSTQGAWELVVNAERVYLNGRLMPSVKFAVEQAQPRRWLFVVNCDNANMALSHDLVEALHKARPVTPDSGVIHITHDGEEIPRRRSTK
jgi:hypothetical protein